jgi:hypothetical protein
VRESRKVSRGLILSASTSVATVLEMKEASGMREVSELIDTDGLENNSLKGKMSKAHVRQTRNISSSRNDLKGRI